MTEARKKELRETAAAYLARAIEAKLNGDLQPALPGSCGGLDDEEFDYVMDVVGELADKMTDGESAS